jgi:hypothetical protein
LRYTLLIHSCPFQVAVVRPSECVQHSRGPFLYVYPQYTSLSL